MRIGSIVKNVKSFFVFKNRVWIFDGNSIIDVNDGKTHSIGPLFGSIHSHNDERLIFQYYTGEFKIFDEGITVGTYKGYYNHLMSDQPQVYFKNVERNIVQFVTPEGEVRDTEFSESGFLIDAYYITFSTNGIKITVNSSTGREYNFSLDKLDANKPDLRVNEPVGIFNDVMVLTLSNGGILLLNFKTGRAEKYLGDASITHNAHQKSNGCEIFFGLNHVTFIEIDADRKTVLRKVNLDHQLASLKKLLTETPNWVTINTSVFDKDSIFFIADKDILGKFDPVDATIKDHVVFTFDKKSTRLRGGKENLKAVGGKVYLSDSNETLYILKE